jgi:hypothetical protein
MKMCILTNEYVVVGYWSDERRRVRHGITRWQCDLINICVVIESPGARVSIPAFLSQDIGCQRPTT